VLESRVYAYEALVRGLNNEPAGVIMAQLTEDNRYAFDQSCRVTAITLAARLGLQHTGARLSINFMPGAVYSPAACIRLTLETAQAVDFPLDHLIFEITEMEEVEDRGHVLEIAQE
jgi:EAL domain-containing protein (putative c-di-GMP-specific phosphodiesterase class I)